MLIAIIENDTIVEIRYIDQEKLSKLKTLMPGSEILEESEIVGKKKVGCVRQQDGSFAEPIIIIDDPVIVDGFNYTELQKTEIGRMLIAVYENTKPSM